MIKTITINNGRQYLRRLIAFSILLLFGFSVMLSGICIASHGGHGHDHNGANSQCTACTQIQNAINLIKQFGAAIAGVLAVFTGIFAVSAILKSLYCPISFLTLTGLKIRMNN